MRRSIVATILKKELKDTLRDRRTIATMLLVPMVSYPFMVLVFSEAASAERETATLRTSIVQPAAELPAAITLALCKTEQLACRPAIEIGGAQTSTTDQAAIARTALKEADAVLAAVPGAAQALSSSRSAQLFLFFDETSPHGPMAKHRVEEALGTLSSELLEQRLKVHGLTPALVRPIVTTTRSVASATEVGQHLAALLLPMLVLVFLALAAFYPAIELTAGERERGTLATLLTAPIVPSEIVLGKYLAIVTVAAAAGLLNVTVIVATLSRALFSSQGPSPVALPRLTAALVVGFPVAVLALALVVGAMCLLVASFGRSFRDGANLLSPVLLLLMTPAALAALPSAGLSDGWSLVPVAGVVLWMKALILDQATLGHSLKVIASAGVSAGILLALTARVFADERASFAAEGRRVELGALLRAPPEPGPAAAMAFFSVIFALSYFAGALFTVWPPLWALPVSLLLSLALPAWGVARWLRPRIALLPHGSGQGRPRFFVAATAIGIGGWLGVALPLSWLAHWLWPGAEASARLLGDLLDLGHAPLAAVLVTVAVAPALAEELAFRGVIQGLLRARTGPALAIIGQALLFGAMHGSLLRFLPTTALGVLLGLLRERSGGLWAGILAHALSNACVVLVERLSPDLLARLSGPTPTVWVGTTMVALGIVILQRGLTGEKAGS